MKKTACLMLTLLLSVILLAALPTSGEENIYRDVIRFHVLAASDSDADQADKLAVRDAVIGAFGEGFSAFSDVESAENALNCPEVQEAIRQVAEETLLARGSEKPVLVTFTRESYPVRTYPTFTLPAGEYLSLRILIGEGEGRNWWCVLYPPLCTAGALEEVPFGISDAEYSMITCRGWNLKSKALSLLESVFRKK